MSKDKIKVLYIAGYQRSGSTILQNVLGEISGFFAVGELRTLWEKDLIINRPCGCGTAFRSCEIWDNIIKNAYGGFDKIDIEEMQHLSKSIHTRNLPVLLLPWRDNHLKSRLQVYLKYLEELYKSIKSTTECRVIIDSSKTSMYGYILGLIPSIDLFVLHLVRDSRGTEYSLLRRKNNRHAKLQNHTTLKGSLSWSFINWATMRFLRKSRQRYIKIRYEDFVESPNDILKIIVDFLDEYPRKLVYSVNQEVQIGTHHTIGGSPHRFSTGTIQLKKDDEWEKEMPVNNRRLVTMVTTPLLLRYGYDSIPDIWKNFWNFIILGTLLITRGLGSILKFLLNVALGRVVGAAGSGVYYLFFSWMRVIGTVSGLGLPVYTLRTVSILEGENKLKTSRWFVLSSLGLSTLSGLVITGIVIIFSPQLAYLFLESSDLTYVLRYAGPAGILFTALTILARAFTGRGQANLAITIENNIIPLGLILFLFGGMVVGSTINPQSVLWMYLIISLVTVIFTLWLWLKKEIPQIISENKAKFRDFFQYKQLSGFWWMGIFGVSFSNLPFLLLPRFATPSEIGLFGVAHRYVSMAVTVLDALTNLYAPKFAQYFSNQKVVLLSPELRKSQLFSTLAYLPFVVVFIFFSKPILGFIGEEFIDAQNILWIMTLGQLVNSATGLSGILLNMINQEKLNLYVSIIFSAVMAVLIIGLGNRYGVVGVAWGYSISVAFKFITLYIVAQIILKGLKTPGVR